MIGKIFSHLLGHTEEDLGGGDDNYEELEEGEWIIINFQDNIPLPVLEVDPLENLLIEHPSMSVYQLRDGVHCEGEEEDGDLGSDDEEDSPRPVAVTRHFSWRLAGWASPLPCHLSATQRARAQAEHKKLSRGALHRQNMAKMRLSPVERRCGHFKQPSPRPYNY